jgi:hypothetical protein
MATPDARRAVQRAQARIERIRSALAHYELMCSGTLSERMMKCGKPNCGCADEEQAELLGMKISGAELAAFDPDQLIQLSAPRKAA